MVDFKTIASGISSGWNIEKNCRYENKIRDSRIHYWTAIYQILSVGQTFDVADKALKTAGQTIPLGTARVICMASPVVLAFLSGRKITSPLLNKTIHFARKNVGVLSSSITVVSTVALVVFGNYAFACASIAYLTFGMAGRKFLPLTVSVIIERYGYVVSSAFSIIWGNPLDKMLVVASFTDHVVSAFFYFKESMQEPVAQPKKMNPRDLQDVIAAKKHLEINKNHLRIKIVEPKAPQENEDYLLNKFEEIDRGDPLFKKLLHLTSFWTERGSVIYGQGREKECLRVGITRLIERSKNNEILKRYCRLLIKQFKESQDNDILRESIVNLAVAGLYDDATMTLRTKEIYRFCFQENSPKNGRLRGYVLEKLQSRRDELFRGIYNSYKKSLWLRTCGKFVDLDEASWYNSYVNTYGVDYKLIECKEDEMGEVSSAQNKFWCFYDRYLGSSYWETNFWNKYDVKEIIDFVSRKVNDEAIREWFKDRDKNIDLEEKRRRYVEAMLVEMGVLKAL